MIGDGVSALKASVSAPSTGWRLMGPRELRRIAEEHARLVAARDRAEAEAARLRAELAALRARSPADL